MGALLYGVIGGHGHHGDLAVLVGNQKDHTAAQLLFQLVAQVAELVHVNILDSRCQELNAGNIHDFVHDIAQSALGFLVLQGLVLASDSLQFFLKLSDMVCQSGGSSLKEGCRRVHFLFQVLIVGSDIGAGDGFDTSYACRYAAFGKDLELADLAGVLNMCTAAEFYGIRHGDHADLFAVLLAEQSHGAGLSGILDAHDLCLHGSRSSDPFIDSLLHGFDLFGGHGLEVAEVEPGPVGVLIGALLLYVVAQDIPEGLLQQMGRGVVAAGLHAVLSIHLHGN